MGLACGGQWGSAVTTLPLRDLVCSLCGGIESPQDEGASANYQWGSIGIKFSHNFSAQDQSENTDQFASKQAFLRGTASVAVD